MQCAPGLGLSKTVSVVFLKFTQKSPYGYHTRFCLLPLFLLKCSALLTDGLTIHNVL